ncbi:hypothetical protein [Atopobium sp. oral taxon 416]|uniref:hypothetical protein n=1 Tax=Atopobium sp. oral taxon 416 TaxID=712157 RepID=UPI001BAB1073|nr:hypothetical protein [Atopobium sp. oral taxon 416]QUC04287.1 hypothetical protein J4859_04950 [Atopobium sp. oral taxon 416]
MCYNAQLGLAAKGWIDEMYIEESTLKDTAGYHAMREGCRATSYASPWRSTCIAVVLYLIASELGF